MYFLNTALLLSFFILSPANASGPVIEMTLTSVAQGMPGETFGLRFEKRDGRCEGFHAESSDNTRGWRKIPLTACTAVWGYLEKHRSEIQRDPRATRDPVNDARRAGFGDAPTGILRLEGLHISVDWFVSELCDVTLTKCHATKLSASSELGKIMREQLTKATP